MKGWVKIWKQICFLLYLFEIYKIKFASIQVYIQKNIILKHSCFSDHQHPDSYIGVTLVVHLPLNKMSWTCFKTNFSLIYLFCKIYPLIPSTFIPEHIIYLCAFFISTEMHVLEITVLISTYTKHCITFTICWHFHINIHWILIYQREKHEVRQKYFTAFID